MPHPPGGPQVCLRCLSDDTPFDVSLAAEATASTSSSSSLLSVCSDAAEHRTSSISQPNNTMCSRRKRVFGGPSDHTVVEILYECMCGEPRECVCEGEREWHFLWSHLNQIGVMGSALGMFVAERHERITIFISGTRQNA